MMLRKEITRTFPLVHFSSEKNYLQAINSLTLLGYQKLSPGYCLPIKNENLLMNFDSFEFNTYRFKTLWLNIIIYNTNSSTSAQHIKDYYTFSTNFSSSHATFKNLLKNQSFKETVISLLCHCQFYYAQSHGIFMSFTSL